MSRIRADKFVNNAANGAPQLTYGVEVIAGVGLTGAGSINITGIATAASFSGNLTGNISGTTGTFSGDVDIADKIIHTGDTDTAIRFPAADTFTVETSGSEAIRVDSSGRLVIGSSGRTAGDVNAQLQVEGTSFATSSLNLISNAGASAGNVSHITLAKSRGSADGSNTIVASGDNLGSIQFAGADGTDINSTAALISAAVDGTPGSNDMPGRLVFSTTPDGAAAPTEKLRILSGGGITFNGDTATANALDDYEEGTWIPSIGGNATYTNQVGTYVKVGRMVLAQWALTINAQGTGSAISAISGLPFLSGVAGQVTSNLLWGSFGVSMAYAVYYVGNASTTMNLSYIATAATALTNNPNGLTDGATINGTMIYYASS